MSALDDAIERGWAAARREEPGPTIGYFRDLAGQHPGHDSVAAFLALALTSAGRCEEAVARLIVLALDRIGGEDLGDYQWALRNYAAELSS
jgi:hypothetical protein